jgi:hypothetical protein
MPAKGREAATPEERENTGGRLARGKRGAARCLLGVVRMGQAAVSMKRGAPAKRGASGPSVPQS